MRMKELVAGGLVSLVLAGCGPDDDYCGRREPYILHIPIILGGERVVQHKFLTTSSSTTTGCSYSGLEEYKKNQ